MEDFYLHLLPGGVVYPERVFESKGLPDPERAQKVRALRVFWQQPKGVFWRNAS